MNGKLHYYHSSTSEFRLTDLFESMFQPGPSKLAGSQHDAMPSLPAEGVQGSS